MTTSTRIHALTACPALTTLALSTLALSTLALIPAHASAQIAEAGFTTSMMNVAPNHVNNSVWQGWSFGNQNYGIGTNLNGGSGSWTHTYSAGLLTNITVNINELRNEYSPFHNFNDPGIRIYGGVQFTPAVNTPYAIGGSIDMVLSGSAASSSSASGSVVLQQLSGPTLASFGSSFARNSNVSIVNNVFDSAAPLSGSNTGMLLAGVTYRLIWDFSANSLINGDTCLYANVFNLSGPQFFSISFLPTPGSAAILGLGTLLAARRRR